MIGRNNNNLVYIDTSADLFQLSFVQWKFLHVFVIHVCFLLIL